MNWKQEASAILGRYLEVKAGAESLRRELQDLDRALPSLAPEERKEALARRSALREALETSRRFVRNADRALGRLTREERRVLQALVIRREKGAVEELCRLLGREPSTVYRRRDRALSRFTRYMYGASATG